MTAHPDPRLTLLFGRLARLRELDTEAAMVTAGMVSLAAELGLLPRLLSDEAPALNVSSAYWATTQSVSALISSGAVLLHEIEQERRRQADAQRHRPDTSDYQAPQLEPRPVHEASR